MTAAVLGPLAGLALALAALLVGVRPALRPVPIVDSPEVVAYREGRQCRTSIYSGYSAPERCVFPEDHYGECDDTVRRPRPRVLGQPARREVADPWAVES